MTITTHGRYKEKNHNGETSINTALILRQKEASWYRRRPLRAAIPKSELKYIDPVPQPDNPLPLNGIKDAAERIVLYHDRTQQIEERAALLNQENGWGWSGFA
jgi:hypothetical protein